MINLTPLDAAKQAIADKDVLYSQHELRSILANLIDYYEKPVTVTANLAGGFVPGFEMPNDQLDYSIYPKP